MIPDPVVVVAATPRSWASDLRAHAADHGGVVIRATVLTPEDALAEQCGVVLVDDVTSFLTATFVAQLQSLGRAVLGLYDPGDSQGKSDLVDAGVDALAPADINPGDLVVQVARLASRSPADRPAPRPGPERRGAAGRLVGVTGPPGGVGVTEIAIELAARLAVGGVSTALVDADELAPSHAQRLGLPLHPNLRTALYAVEHSKPIARCLHPLATRRPLTALTGMAVSDDWGAVPPSAPGKLVTALAATHGAVVVDLGHCLPRSDGATGLRFGHALGLVGCCTDLVVVAAPTPMAVTRAIEMVARLRPAARRVHLVLNRVGPDRYVRDESVAELRSATETPVVHQVAEDAKVGRAAWQGGRVHRGRFTADVGQVVRDLGWA